MASSSQARDGAMNLCASWKSVVGERIRRAIRRGGTAGDAARGACAGAVPRALGPRLGFHVRVRVGDGERRSGGEPREDMAMY
jgi:hypothetical protein